MRFNKSVMATAVIVAFTVFGGQNAYAVNTKQTQKNDEHSQTETVNNTETLIDVLVKDGDTLTAIAEDNRTTVDAIVEQNNLTNLDIIEPGQVLKITPSDIGLVNFINGIETAAASFMKPLEPEVQIQPVVYQSVSNSYYIGNGMWCTDYVHSRRPDVPIYGNAGYGWVTAAQNNGRATGSVAQAGAIAIQNGHVAYVESVNADGSYNVSEMQTL